jgi:hypothetical protein
MVDQNGNVLAGVRVQLSRYDGGSFCTTTNYMGSYSLDLPTGFYTITATLPSYNFARYNIRIVSGFPSAGPDIVGYPSFTR